ncbi:FecR domain-containing protein [Mesorhizobium sp. WSM2239]|uniref:FecR domain-containing protein n=2 Tax=unclassified Mesorhizobium TaxID=325217 RepID=A0AAU8D8R3_9HYPH
MRGTIRVSLALAALACVQQAAAEPVPRAQPAAGSVIARKSGEEVRFIEVSSWQVVDLRQDVVPGDYLRTNANGTLAVLFSDRTQMRLGRNTTLLVKEIGADTRFSLEQGSIWARAERGGGNVTVDTPAAAAAIRGTDWTMTVDGNGRTSLAVLEGLVELSNEFGSVSVAEGEAAAASIGQAPTKVVIVDPDDREQMLFYLSLRNSFGWMPVSPLSSPEMRAVRARIGAKPEQSRSAEEWLTLAEVSLSYDGKRPAIDAAEQARAFRLTPSQKARLDLIDALAAGAAQQYAQAALLFERAAPRVDAKRRAIALYGGYFARSLADPDRVEKPPVVSGGGPYAALAEAWTAGFLKDIPAAIEVIRRAEVRYPDDPSLPAYRAQLAILVDDRTQVEEAIARSLSLDPDDPTALEARANYKAGVQGDIGGALADAKRAVEIAPGSTTIWNVVGNLQSARGGEREAEAAYLRSIELDPHDPVSYANLAILYLDQDRVKDAKVMIDKAMAVDPSFDIGLIARGRYYLQTGEMDKAIENLLAGTTANPAYAQGLLMLAAGYYESGERAPAEQALENADRLDPNDPTTSNFETAIAIDAYESDRAIRSAQESLRRSRARGGDYEALSANKDAGSTLNDAFRLQGLDAWGRYYGQAVFDPFAASGYVDQTLAGSPDPFVNDATFGNLAVEAGTNTSSFSSFLQGLMLDPFMISSRSRSANLIRRPFLEASVGTGFTSTANADPGLTTEVELQGFSHTPLPWSFYGTFETRDLNDTRFTTLPGPIDAQVDASFEDITGTGYFATKPTPNDRIVGYLAIRDNTSDFGAATFDPSILVPPVTGLRVPLEKQTESGNAAVAWSHTFGYHSVANAALFASVLNQKSTTGELFDTDVGVIGTTLDTETDQQSYLGAVNHFYGVGDLTLRYGLEGGFLDLGQETSTTVYLGPFPSITVPISSVEGTIDIGRAYFNALYDISPTIKAEAALFGTYLDGDGVNVERLEPRFGIAWAPSEGHWLRAAFLRETSAIDSTTLAPIGILGVQSNQTQLGVGGYSDTFAAQWDAEWSDRLFTSVEYQHQDMHDLAIEIPLTIGTVDFSEGRIDRVSATANVWLGNGFGAFATAAYAVSEIKDPASAGFGAALPFVPEISGRVGMTWVHPSNLKVTVAATYVGERASEATGGELDDFWTADAFLTWEPFDKRFELELAGYNLFDEKFEIAADVPGWGQSFVGSFKVRF